MGRGIKPEASRRSGGLPPASLHVLVAIGPGELHGYSIMGEVERLTDGAVQMGPGTLYGTIKRLVADGLIEESAQRPDPDADDQRRRYYRLTAAGGQALDAELARMRTLVRAAEARGRVPRLGQA